MSLLLNKNNFKEKTKTENGISSENIEKEIIEEKEQNVSKLTNIKVFNGLVNGENDVFSKLNKKNTNKNTKNNKDLDSYLNEKNIDLNYISFGDCDNLFINNLPKESKKIEKQENNNKSDKEKENYSSYKRDIFNNNNKDNILNYDNQKKQKNIVEERLLNKGFQSKNNNKSKDLFNEFIPTKQNMFKKSLVERNERESKNIFKISDIKKGEALIITSNDIIFSFPACLLPKGAKLGDTFSLEIKSFENNYKNKEFEEIEQIQKKYAGKDYDKNNNEIK
jgi:hypothetical protein